MYKQISHEIQGQDTQHNLNNIFTTYSFLPNHEVFAVFFKTFAAFLSFFGNFQANLRRQVVHQHTERRPARDRCCLASPSLDCRFYQLYMISRFHAAQEYNLSYSRPFAGWYFAYLNSAKTFFFQFSQLDSH